MLVFTDYFLGQFVKLRTEAHVLVEYIRCKHSVTSKRQPITRTYRITFVKQRISIILCRRHGLCCRFHSQKNTLKILKTSKKHHTPLKTLTLLLKIDFVPEQKILPKSGKRRKHCRQNPSKQTFNAGVSRWSRGSGHSSRSRLSSESL